MLKIGVLGVGHLGKIHLKCLQLTQGIYDLVGFYDPSDANALTVVEQFGLRRFENLNDFFDAVEVVDIVTPTIQHYELAAEALRRGKHVFIEKPLTRTLEEAQQLIELSKKSNVKVQVGHVERFNPALLALDDMIISPMFIEGHRLAAFNPRGTDVSVVLDLMIHDLDIVLSLVKSKVKFVSASGVAVVSATPDIANARIEFENGCVANLTASRISLKQMRKLRLFQRDAYLSLDFLEKQAQVVRLYHEQQLNSGNNVFPLETDQGTKWIQLEQPDIEPVNAIKLELESLAASIQQNTKPKVPIEDGYRALDVAYRIIEDMQRRQEEAHITTV